MEWWIVNASPLICRAKAGNLDLVLKLPNEVIVPSAVVEDFRQGNQTILHRLL